MEKRLSGLDRISCGMALGTPLASVSWNSLDRFATEVMPAFRTVRAAAAE